MLYKFKAHPRPGYYDKEGKLVTAETSGSASIRKKSALANLGFNGGGLGGGGGGLGGGPGGAGDGFGGTGSSGQGFGSFSDFGGGRSAATVDRYNPVRDRLDEGSVVEDWIPRDAAGLDQMFRLMFHRDHIAGTITDLICEIIWSNFGLVGVNDPVIRNLYIDSMSAIDSAATLPDLTREFLVLGRTVASMIFNQEKGIFTDVVSHDPDFLRITPIPIRGFDPKIDLMPSPGLRAFVDSEDPRDLDALQVLPPSFVHAIREAGSYGGGSSLSATNSLMSRPPGAGPAGHADGMLPGAIPLDPINTLFVARRVFNNDYIGTSFFTRLITFWALEKALINATVTSARRRARSILHVKAGLENLWEPTAQELDNLAGMWIQADEDPVGSVVVTRTGVDSQEVRSGQDFYKWSDEWQMLNEGKLRALGANDALLSGDATYSNQESARLFFMERLEALRTSLTRRVFYQRFFPLLARIHGFKKVSQAELSHNVRIDRREKTQISVAEETKQGVRLTQREALTIPDSQLIIPTIEWQKELTYKVDDRKLEVFELLEDRGVPIHLRNWAAAGNINLDSQMSGLEDDGDLRRRVQMWKMEWENTLDIAEQEAKLEFIKSLKGITHSNLKKVVGSAIVEIGPLSEWIFWEEDGSLGPLKATELAEYLKKYDPGSNDVLRLTDVHALQRDLSLHFKNQTQAELAHYLIFRTGLTKTKPSLSHSTIDILSTHVKSALDQYSSNASVYQLGKLAQKELRLVGSLSATNRDQAIGKLNGSSKRLGKHIQGKVDYKIDNLPSNSTNLYAGKDV